MFCWDEIIRGSICVFAQYGGTAFGHDISGNADSAACNQLKELRNVVNKMLRVTD